MSAEESGAFRVDWRRLHGLCVAIQVGFGVPENDAVTVADCLVEANLTGLDTHGVIRLKFYLDRVRAGGINAHPSMHMVRETACTALVDADNALGPVGAVYGMETAIRKATVSGIGLVLVRNANHYGPAGHYARMAAAVEMIGVSLTNVLGCMPPTGGARPRVGNNPYAIAFPAGSEPPVVVDGATSKASWGRLFLCAQTGEPLPADCYVDAAGRPTRDASAVLDGGALLPFAEHKGYGIAAAITLLTGMLAESALDHDIPHPYKKLGEPGANTFLMGALKVQAFSDPLRFAERMDEWIRMMRATPPAPGVERVWLPGEKEGVTRAERVENGIPLNPAMLAELRELAADAGVGCEL